MPQLKLRALWLSIGWLGIAIALGLGIMHPPAIAFDIKYFDKLMHGLSHGLLMLWFANLYFQIKSRILICLGLMMLGALIELLQYHLPYRSFEAMDILANCIGVFMGWLAGMSLLKHALHWFERICLR